LADLSRDELARGMAACRESKYPPTLPEFRSLCRPPVDFEAAFVEAVQQMRLRDTGEDHWSSPAVFWAAATIGSFDLRNATWGALEKRWKKVLQAELNKGEWQPIPARALALPAPTTTEEDRKAAGRVLAAVQIKNQGSKDWMKKLQERVVGGERLPHCAVSALKEALAA